MTMTHAIDCHETPAGWQWALTMYDNGVQSELKSDAYYPTQSEAWFAARMVAEAKSPKPKTTDPIVVNPNLVVSDRDAHPYVFCIRKTSNGWQLNAYVNVEDRKWAHQYSETLFPTREAAVEAARVEEAKMFNPEHTLGSVHLLPDYTQNPSDEARYTVVLRPLTEPTEDGAWLVSLYILTERRQEVLHYAPVFDSKKDALAFCRNKADDIMPILRSYYPNSTVTYLSPDTQLN